MRRRIEVVEGAPCACVAKTDRERDGDAFRITCRACDAEWWRGLTETVEKRNNPLIGSGMGPGRPRLVRAS